MSSGLELNIQMYRMSKEKSGGRMEFMVKSKEKRN
jgi:hypothetical protein